MSATPTLFTPALSTAWYRDSRSTRSDLKESSLETAGPHQQAYASSSSTHSSLTPDLDALGLDVGDDLKRGLGDVGHVLAVAVLTQEARRADDDVDAVNTRLDGGAGILEVAADVCASGSG